MSLSTWLSGLAGFVVLGSVVPQGIDDDVARSGAGVSTRVAPIAALAFAPGGERLLAGSQHGVRVLEWPALRAVGELAVDLAAVHDLRFAPGGARLAVAGGTAANGGRVDVLGWPGGEAVHSARSGEDVVHCVAWRPDAQVYAAASHDRAVRIHDARTGAILDELRAHSRPVLAVTYFAGGRYLASAGDDASVRVFAADTLREIRSLDHHAERVTALAEQPAAPGGTTPLVASASTDGTVRFWQPEIGRLVRFARLPAKQLAVAWTADGRYAVSAASDGRVRVVDPANAQVLVERAGVPGWAHALAVAPAGAARGVAVGGDGGRVVRVEIDVADRREGEREQPETKP